MPRRFLAWHCLRDPAARSGGGSAQLTLARRLQEREASRSKKTLGTAFSWKSVATDRRMGEMSSHLPLVFFLFFFFFFFSPMQLKAATQPAPPRAC